MDKSQVQLRLVYTIHLDAFHELDPLKYWFRFLLSDNSSFGKSVFMINFFFNECD